MQSALRRTCSPAVLGSVRDIPAGSGVARKLVCGTHPVGRKLFGAHTQNVAARIWGVRAHANVPLSDESYDVIVVGGGHAGCEAALAAARLGAKTMLLTLSLDKIAWQPCNPAVGGAAKSQLVHEVDALGGWIGKLADKTYVQKRTLNESKGPAVWALRAQTDKLEYSAEMRKVLEGAPNLFLREGMAVSLTFGSNDDVTGVETHFGMHFGAAAVVLTTGTFMNGTIWVGRKQLPAGRAGEAPSVGLTEHLHGLGFETGRLKTGTPARVDRTTVDFSVMTPQPGDAKTAWFTFDTTRHVEREQMPCHLTHTNAATHALIREHLHESPQYGGWVESAGPRYCPSIEDKVVRFADKASHQIFIEPEGRTTPELYIQGFSTGLPERLQRAMLRTLPGLEACRMLRPAYAVEYDFLPAYQCRSTLETRKFQGLFFSGQLNGTTGYEEAAAQGLLAGLNAARRAQGAELVTLSRESSYIGTLVDDLVTKDLREPYRMLTSRSEYRLLLRSDNADVRLTPLGHELGLVGEEQWQRFNGKQRRKAEETERLATVTVQPDLPLAKESAVRSGHNIRQAFTLDHVLRQPHVHYSILDEYGYGNSELSNIEKQCVEIDVKYKMYIVRQQEQLNKLKTKLHLRLPDDLDYLSIGSMSLEGREVLAKIRPSTLGQAQRLANVNPADINALMIHLEVRRRQKQMGAGTWVGRHPSSAQRRRLAATPDGNGADVAADAGADAGAPAEPALAPQAPAREAVAIV